MVIVLQTECVTLTQAWLTFGSSLSFGFRPTFLVSKISFSYLFLISCSFATNYTCEVMLWRREGQGQGASSHYFPQLFIFNLAAFNFYLTSECGCSMFINWTNRIIKSLAVSGKFYNFKMRTWYLRFCSVCVDKTSSGQTIYKFSSFLSPINWIRGGSGISWNNLLNPNGNVLLYWSLFISFFFTMSEFIA